MAQMLRSIHLEFDNLFNENKFDEHQRLSSLSTAANSLQAIVGLMNIPWIFTRHRSHREALDMMNRMLYLAQYFMKCLKQDKSRLHLPFLKRKGEG